MRRAVEIVHREDAWQSVEAGDRQRLVPFERRFKELGVTAGAH